MSVQLERDEKVVGGIDCVARDVDFTTVSFLSPGSLIKEVSERLADWVSLLYLETEPQSQLPQTKSTLSLA